MNDIADLPLGARGPADTVTARRDMALYINDIIGAIRPLLDPHLGDLACADLFDRICNVVLSARHAASIRSGMSRHVIFGTVLHDLPSREALKLYEAVASYLPGVEFPAFYEAVAAPLVAIMRDGIAKNGRPVDGFQEDALTPRLSVPGFLYRGDAQWEIEFGEFYKLNLFFNRLPFKECWSVTLAPFRQATPSYLAEGGTTRDDAMAAAIGYAFRTVMAHGGSITPLVVRLFGPTARG